jgi:hypothetical protein
MLRQAMIDAKDLKEVDMGTRIVAMIVESIKRSVGVAFCQLKRKERTYL